MMKIVLCKVEENYGREIENYNQVSCCTVILLCVFRD